MDLKDAYNLIGEKWDQIHTNDDWWVPGVNVFADFLGKDKQILDVGCGVGHQAEYLVKKGLKITGIDFAEKLLEIAKQKVPEGEFHFLDLRDLKHWEQQFDGVFAQAVLLHFTKIEVKKIFKILSEKVKPGGYFFVAVKEIGPDGIEEKLVYDHPHSRYGVNIERLFSFYTEDEIEQLFLENGFKVVWSEKRLGNTTNWLNFIGQKSL